MEQIEIFPLNSDYLEDVLEIENLCFSTPWKKISFISEFHLSYSFSFGIVSKNDNKLRGYIFFWLVCDEIHITNLAIDPAVRKEGLGSSLLKFLIQMGSDVNVKKIYLEVRKSNHAGKALYNKFGFVQTGYRSQYYSDNQEDALLFTYFFED
jgi:ribosomal-protein-alanine N-acetyltransferase